MKQLNCPFCHKPSVIARDNQYFCFACGMGGDRVSYVATSTHDSYEKAAIGLQVKMIKAENREDEVKKVLRALSEAEKFYFNSVSSLKESYFKKRKLSTEVINKFHLGYSEGGERLHSFLSKKRITDRAMEQAGLLCVAENGDKFEKFWKRVMFPIHDKNGNTIGFGGRVLGDQKPKYLNSPESIVFDKSHNLYALDIAKESPEDYFFLCEGYVDVISMHQNGFSNAIASLGTAFTVGHAELLHKYKNKVYIVYDSDEPGQKATEKAISLLLKEDVDVQVVSVAPYKDVDELLVAEGEVAFQNRIANAVDGKRYLLKRKTPEEVVRFLMTEF